MKIRLPSHQALQSIPKEMREQWKNFGLLVEDLTRAFNRGIELEDNLSHNLLTLPVQHGVETTLRHNLNRLPRAILVAGGRVEFLEVLSRSNTDFVVRAKLLSTTVSARNLDTLTRAVTTSDAPFFKEGDVVLVDGAVNTVERVTQTQLQFSRPMVGKGAVPVSLSVDEITLLVL